MITEKMENALNRQIEIEGHSSFVYLSMASWCDKEGLDGCAAFLYRQSDEERDHMMRIFHYISEVDGHAITPSIPAPPTDFGTVQELFSMAYEQEKKVTQSINDLLAICYQEHDYNTLNFLQWYVEEQREEEDQARKILDRINQIGVGPQSLYFINNEIEAINAAAVKAEAAAGV